jgi:DNA-binding response OmpR family regulator
MIFRPESFEDRSEAENKDNRRPKILFIDDDEDVLEILKQQFYYAGYETIQATNAEDGLKIMLEGCPDGVVLDIFLPGMDGWTLAKTIRETEQLAHLPVVLGTGFYTGAEAKAKALEFGIDAFVVKPYDNDVLLNILNDMVERYFGLAPTPPEIQADDTSTAEPNPTAEADVEKPVPAVKEPDSA